MSRRELYRRTKGCSVYGVSLFAVSAVESFAIAAIGNHETPSPMWMLLAILFNCGAVMVLFLSYRNYWLDLIQKATVGFDGEVFSGGPIIGAPLERGWNWKLIEQGANPPQQFFLCLPPMKKRYDNSTLIQDVCSGPVSFYYLKRSRYIVEITSISKPEPDKRSKHAQKKARRKAGTVI